MKTSGRGIFLMRTFMDEFDVRRSHEGGAEIVMAKRIPSSPDRTPVSGVSDPFVVVLTVLVSAGACLPVIQFDVANPLDT